KNSNYKIECFISFLSAGSSDVFRVVGGSVQLEIKGSVSEFDDFTWIFSGTVNVLKYSKRYKDVTHSPDYEHRVEFNEETCSLILKNLQKTDSGLYKIEVSNALQTTTLYTYILSVLDPVEPPVLNVYSSTDPCNSTLTCRGHDLSITSTCYKETCEEKEVTSPGGVALFLSVRDSVIICNYSNPASWKQDKITFTHLCPDTGTHTLTHTHTHTCTHTVIASMLICSSFYWRHKASLEVLCIFFSCLEIKPLKDIQL
uniref:Immunoglobulin domain-containing protein n=1 Tax=Astyanax mexicanus TaxID=7994 RepID=A0A3B1KFT5_ASTMX